MNKGESISEHKNTVTIIVNGRPKEVAKERLTFEEVVELAFPGGLQNPNTAFTVTYAKGEDKKQGTLVAGESVKVKEEMIFNVTATDKS